MAKRHNPQEMVNYRSSYEIQAKQRKNEYADGDSDLYGGEDDGEQDEGQTNGQAPPGEEGGDLINYKGIYYNDDQGQKYTDPETGAHFEFKDMCRRLHRIQQKRDSQSD